MSSVCPSFVLCEAQGTPPPWILKRDGLECSGQRLISSLAKLREHNFFVIFFLHFIFLKEKKNIFMFDGQIFAVFFLSQDWSGLETSD